MPEYQNEYFCICAKCKNQFEGNKHDFLCPECVKKQSPIPVASRQDEICVTNSMTGGQKGSKLAHFDLIPFKPLWALAELYGRGLKKYAPRNWEKGYEWSMSFAAMMRHAWLFWNGEDYDACGPDCPPDCKIHTGSHHLDNVAWHAFTLREFFETHPELDDRPNTKREK